MFLPGWPPCFYIPKALNSLVFSHGTLTQHLALLTTSFSYNYCPLFIGSCPPLILTCGSSTSSRFYLRPSTLSFRKSLFFLWLAHVLPCASNSQISLQPHLFLYKWIQIPTVYQHLWSPQPHRPQTQYDQTQLDPVFPTTQWALPHLLKTILGLMTSLSHRPLPKPVNILNLPTPLPSSLPVARLSYYQNTPNLFILPHSPSPISNHSSFQWPGWSKN